MPGTRRFPLSKLWQRRPVHNAKHNKNLLPMGTGCWVAILLQLISAGALARAGESVSASRELPRIESGTRIVDEGSGRWNRIVLLARPRISSGDVNSLPSAIRDSVSEFVLTILASVEPTEDQATGQLRYRLVDVGVGYSTEVDGELRAVTVADAAQAGVNLGWFNRLMLTENERQLTTVRIIVRTSSLMIFDVPAIVLRGSQHREYLMRHFVWIDARTGRNALLVWLLTQQPAGGTVIATEEAPRWAPAGLREDRAIHVDGKQFNLLGIPNRKAFAIEQLPPGKAIPWSEEAQAVAALEQYDIDALRRLSTALNNMLHGSP